MEIEAPVWLDKDHPNYERWERSRKLAEARGRFVVSIISQKIPCKKLDILDIGSGEGGTASVLSEQNNVVSIELSRERIKNQQKKSGDFFTVNGDALYLPFRKGSFDLLILQDVIEHAADSSKLISEAERVLKPGGFLYLSTPNKTSVINFISDPHWGLPFVSVLKRKNIRNYFLKYFRKKDFSRNDIAQLFSLKELKELTKNFKLDLFTRHSVEELLNKNEGIIWSNFHKRLAAAAESLHIRRVLLRTANNKHGIINKYFTPTFYTILTKRR